ncbi:MAG TPA: hypothetical protein VFL85_01525 [Candidatus Saccharimonadales bacterium]|nr:hypothetical protein [Candidatus Saccharimonadales bacterium]
MKYYVVHPGSVTLDTGETIELDAGTLASNYGLSDGEYYVDTPVQETSQGDNIIHIHLYPRPDNKYQNIKTLLGDNGTDVFYDKPVGWRKQQAERRKYF